jgi:hypothetical protein
VKGSRQRWSRTFEAITFAWLLVAQAAATADPYTPFTARYQLTRDDVVVGETQVILERPAPQRYSYRALTEPSSLVSLIRDDRILEESSGQFLAGRARPDRYLYERESGDSVRRLRLDFDWPGNRIRVSGGSPNWTLEAPDGVLDKLVQQLVFSHDLAAGQREVDYRVADGGLLKDYSYRVTGSETLDTALGRLATLRAERSKNQESPDYTLWLAPTLGHLPVRILRRHQGSRYRMDLMELRRP